MLVFCSHRGLSPACRFCEHAIAHRAQPLSFSGSVICNGGQRCNAPRAEIIDFCGGKIVGGGSEIIGEVRCVEVDNQGLLQKVAVAIAKVVEAPKGLSWQEKQADLRHARNVLGEIRDVLRS